MNENLKNTLISNKNVNEVITHCNSDYMKQLIILSFNEDDKQITLGKADLKEMKNNFTEKYYAPRIKKA